MRPNWPWPESALGPMVFLGQICFLDSKDICPHAKDDILLVFHSGEGYHFEWQSLRDGAICEPWKRYQTGPGALQERAASIFRTTVIECPDFLADIIESAAPIFAGREVYGAERALAMAGTRIGPNAAFREDKINWAVEASCIATLAPVYPDIEHPYPFCNAPVGNLDLLHQCLHFESDWLLRVLDDGTNWEIGKY